MRHKLAVDLHLSSTSDLAKYKISARYKVMCPSPRPERKAPVAA